MPKTVGGLIGYVVSALFLTAIGVAIWSRTPLWHTINKG